jgi:hypothetical protein
MRIADCGFLIPISKFEFRNFNPMLHAPCPMPHAPCPMPHAPLPVVAASDSSNIRFKHSYCKVQSSIKNLYIILRGEPE